MYLSYCTQFWLRSLRENAVAWSCKQGVFRLLWGRRIRKLLSLDLSEYGVSRNLMSMTLCRTVMLLAWACGHRNGSGHRLKATDCMHKKMTLIQFSSCATNVHKRGLISWKWESPQILAQNWIQQRALTSTMCRYSGRLGRQDLQ